MSCCMGMGGMMTGMGLGRLLLLAALILAAAALFTYVVWRR